jgi:lipid-A-disaccharide synthase
MSPRIGMVAAEPSGDTLGAGLIRAIRERVPDARFEGIGGPQMIAAGCESWFPMERLSVMGLVEVLRHLRDLLAIRAALVRRWRADPPALFVGVDGPDFNLGLEARLRRAGVPTAHYVCPTVWAWRQGRVRTLRASADLVLSIFPFESHFLAAHGVAARYVGHPLADEIAPQPDPVPARRILGIAGDATVVAVLPGSRLSEIDALGPIFADAACRLAARNPRLQPVTPLVNAATRERFCAILAAVAPAAPWRLTDDARTALAAADVVLTASGTATLEALLIGRPMVVGYRLHPLTYRIARWLDLVKVPHIAMANLLVDERLAPELVQNDCTAEHLAGALQDFLDDPARSAAVRARYAALATELRCDTNARAADAVLALLEGKRDI